MNSYPTPRSALFVFSVPARDWLSGCSLLCVLVVILLAGTTEDLLIAMPLLAVAMVVPAPLAYVAGQFAALSPVRIEEPLFVVVTQIVLLVVLTEPTRQHDLPLAMVTTALASLGLGGILIMGIQRNLIVAGGLLCLAIAGVTYLIRRITLVRLGLVDPTVTHTGETNYVSGQTDRQTDTEPKE